jgi:hypothetical protein
MNDKIRSTPSAGFAEADLMDVPQLGGSAGHHTEALTYDSRRITIAPTVVSFSAVSPTTP